MGMESPEEQLTTAEEDSDMNNTATIEQLRAMRFSAMAKELELQMNDPSAYSQLGFEDRLGLLVDAEWNRRQANRLQNVSGRPIWTFLRQQWKESNTTRTVDWIKRNSFASPPVNTSMMSTISS